jgi:N-methylhydantoinase B
VSDSYAKGRVPADPSALLSEPEILPGVARMALNSDDALEVATSGGGGWGDAIEREPDRVASDVRGGLVSVDHARAIFGVALDGDGAPHASATAARREEILRTRAAQINAADAAQTSHRHESPADAPQQPAAGWPTVTTPLSDSGPAARFSLARSYCPECLRLVSVERQLVEARGTAR